VTVAELCSLEADLYSYLRKKNRIISAGFSAVIGDVIQFTSMVIERGLTNALGEITPNGRELADESFIKVADLVAEHHLRLIAEPDREIVRKSLLEAYFHAAGPQRVFEPAAKTHFLQSLRRFGTRDFAALLLSLFVFNSISIAIQDEVRGRMPDIRSFEIYMLGLENICRDAVRTAVELSTSKKPDDDWVRAVAEHVERQLVRASSSV
jgi:hypothetical protein